MYLFRDRGGRLLYVGKATDLRSRVRSYFSTDDRRKIGPMLREAQTIDHHPCGIALEAAVLEVRLLHALRPRYNRQGTRWEQAAYVRLDTSDAYPRLVVGRSHRGRGVVLGPLPVGAGRPARRRGDRDGGAAPAVLDPARRRRCHRSATAPCAAAQLGVAHCPCAGTVDDATYRRIVDRVVRGLTGEPDAAARSARRAHGRPSPRAERYEEAADSARPRRPRSPAPCGASAASTPSAPPAGSCSRSPAGRRAELDQGVLRAAWADGELPGLRRHRPVPATASRRRSARRCPPTLADELDRRGVVPRPLRLPAPPPRGRGPVGHAAPRAPGLPPGNRLAGVVVVIGDEVPAARDRRSAHDGGGYGRPMLNAFVLVDAEPTRVAELAAALAELDGVAEVYSVTGTVDLVAIVRVREQDELADVVTRRIGALAGITGTETMVAFQAFSRHDLEAIWAVGLGEA